MLVFGRKISGDKIGATATGVIGTLATAIISVADHYGLQIAPWVWATFTLGVIVCVVGFLAFFLHISWVAARDWGMPLGSRSGALVAVLIALVGSATILVHWGFVAKETPAPPASAHPIAPRSARTPAIDDLVGQLIVDEVNGSNVVGHFLLTNKSTGTFDLGVVQYQAPGLMLSTVTDRLPRVIRPGRKLSIPIESKNGLAVIGSVRLQFEYELDGIQQPTAAFYQFDNEGGFRVGIYDPGNCCELKSVDLGALGQHEVRNIFSTGAGVRLHGVKEADGYQSMADASAQKALIFDPARRRVWLIAVEHRVPKVLVAPMERTANGEHLIEAWWKGRPLSLTVDGKPGVPDNGSEDAVAGKR